MIRQPLLLLACLTGVVAAVKFLSRRPPWDKAFDVLPVPFWCYMLPMLGTTAGLFPSASPLYVAMSKWALPLCLAWILLGVDVRALGRVGGRAAALMAAGSGGMVLGTAAAAFLLRGWFPDQAWKSLGALAATWTGGSANMLAVKEALAIPEDVFAPIIMVDGLFTYGWMSFLVAAAGLQKTFDRWTGAAAGSIPSAEPSEARPIPFAAALALGAALAVTAVVLSPQLPDLRGALTPAAWAVLLSTTGALAAAALLSHTGRGMPAGLERTGSFLLLILMASLGARATVQSALQAPVFLAAGALILACHAAALLAAAKLLRAPLALAATASQACLGGVISAPMVAAVYSPALAAVGLLLAVAANAVGTYIGLMTAFLCQWVMK